MIARINRIIVKAAKAVAKKMKKKPMTKDELDFANRTKVGQMIKGYKKATSDPHYGELFKKAFQLEHDGLMEKHKTLKRVLRSKARGHRLMRSHLFFHLKPTGKKDENGDPEIEKGKCRWVCDGSSQRKGIEVDITVSSMPSQIDVRVMTSECARKGRTLRQSDVPQAFLFGAKQKVMYAEYPKGLKNEVGYGLDDDGNEYVLEVTGSWCGSRDSAAVYERHYSEFMVEELGFTRGIINPSLHTKGLGAKDEIVAQAFVDDNFYHGEDHMIKWYEAKMNKKWGDCKAKDAEWLLGMSVIQNERGIQLTVQHSIEEAAKRFIKGQIRSVKTPLPPGVAVNANDMPDDDADVCDQPYRELIGTLQWWSTTCRGPDLAHAVSQLARVGHRPAKCHWKLAMHVLRHVVSTKEKGLWFPKCNQGAEPDKAWVDAYCDSSWADTPGAIGDSVEKNRDAFRSTSGHVARCGGAPVAWSSSAQKLITLSSTEAELVETVSAAKMVKYVRSTLMELTGAQNLEPTTLFEDNQPVLHILDVESKGVKKRARHISARWFAVREWQEAGEIKLAKVDTKGNLADVMTKALPTMTFEHLRDGMVSDVDRPNPQLKFDKEAESISDASTWATNHVPMKTTKRRRIR